MPIVEEKGDFEKSDVVEAAVKGLYQQIREFRFLSLPFDSPRFN